MAARRGLALAITAVLLLAGSGAMTMGASASHCPDTDNPDCPAPPSPSQFAQLAEDTLFYFPSSPVRSELVRKVQQSQEALYPPNLAFPPNPALPPNLAFPPNPALPPNPARSYTSWGRTRTRYGPLAGTPNGATDAGTSFLLNEASVLQSQIVAAFPDAHPPNPA
jgi:hypothetical protein